MNWAMSLFQTYNPESHLDVGCGYGYLNDAMRLGGCWSIGVDWSEHCIKKATAEGIKSTIALADVRDGLPQFEKNQFDIVTAFNLLDRIPITDLNKAIQSIARVAKQPILIELTTGKDDRNPDWSGYTGDLSLVSVYSLGFWQKLFANHKCVMFECNFDRKMVNAAIMFMKQETPRETFEAMTEMRLRNIYLRLGLHEDMKISSKEDFEKLTREEIIDAIVAKNDQLIEAKAKQRPHQLIKDNSKSAEAFISHLKKPDGTG